MSSILLIVALTLFYTFEGGMEAVIWTDVVQMFLYVGGAIVSLFVIVQQIPQGWDHIWQVAGAANKLRVFDFRFEWSTEFFARPYSFWAGVLGGCFLTTASQLATLLSNANAPARSRSCNSACNVGTNAAVNAPSPSRRRNRFGKLKAVTNASLNTEVPKIAAPSRSRPRPSTRETTVSNDTIPMFFSFFDTRPPVSRGPPGRRKPVGCARAGHRAGCRSQRSSTAVVSAASSSASRHSCANAANAAARCADGRPRAAHTSASANPALR